MSARRAREMESKRRHTKMLAVAKRDGWACWICDEPVDPTPDHRGVNPERATLDHVVELGDGGSNAVANLRLAHAICNEMRERNRREIRRAW